LRGQHRRIAAAQPVKPREGKEGWQSGASEQLAPYHVMKQNAGRQCEDISPAYSRFAQMYDWVMHDVDYEMWADYILGLIRPARVNGKDLLDLACGTGNVSFAMARRGYRVTGLDLSPEMLDVARKKGQDLVLAPVPLPDGTVPTIKPVEFVQGDMRDFHLGRQFHVITCLYDSINYLRTEDDLARTLMCARAHLKRGGIFIFDVNTEYQLARSHNKRAMMFEKGDQIVLFWQDRWIQKTKIWQVRLTGFVKEGDLYRRFREMHEERAYSAAEVTSCLDKAGFRRVTVYEAYAFQPSGPQSPRLYFVARA